MNVKLEDKPDPIEILLVEDNEGDIDLTRESLEQSKLFLNLNVVRDGKTAMDYLQRRNGYEDATRPDIILLDLNLPKLSGQNVLKKIKSDDTLQAIPVAVLSASEAQEDIEKSYQEHANCYITKPLGFNQFQQLVEQFETFWFSIVRLPD